MTERFEAITPAREPKRVVVVLASDYDAMRDRWLHQVDINDRLRGMLASNSGDDIHGPGCEQDSGDPYCGCRVRHARLMADTKPALCRCGRPNFYAVGDPTPYCPGCEYMASATCDCSGAPI